MAKNANADIPSSIVEIIDDLGCYMPPNYKKLDNASKHIIDLPRKNLCQTCESPLGEDTMIVVNQLGVVMAFCGGACMSDMQVMGWIQEQYDDHVQRIKFRGGEGGN